MSIFDFFNKKKQFESASSDVDYLKEILEDFSKRNYLGKAADAGCKAKAAVKLKEYDKAWGFYHEQKSFYMQHAKHSGFTNHQVLALDSQVHEDLANVLRSEKKNDDALGHILYWIVTNNDKPIKRHQQKLAAYFNRCKFYNTSLQEAVEFSTSNVANSDFIVFQSKVSEWRACG